MGHVEAVGGTAQVAMGQERVDEATSRQFLWEHVELAQDRSGSIARGCSEENTVSGNDNRKRCFVLDDSEHRSP